MDYQGVCYLYHFYDEQWNFLTPNEITSPNFRYKYFDGEYMYKTFYGVSDLKGRRYKNRDAIMLMKKKIKG